MHDAEHDAAVGYPFAASRHTHSAGLFHQRNFRHMKPVKALSCGGKRVNPQIGFTL